MNYPINFNSRSEKLSKISRRLIRNNTTLNDRQRKFVKRYYNGRQLLRGFYTDFAVSYLMAMLLDVKKGNVLDTSCGSGRLFEYIPSNCEVQKYGFEIDPESSKICKLLYPDVNIENCDALAKINRISQKFNYVIANPPWGLQVNTENYNGYSLTNIPTKNNSTALFIELGIHSLVDGGRGIFLVPKSLFTNEFKDVIKYMESNGNVLAIIELPSSAFYNSNIMVESCLIYYEKSKDKINQIKTITISLVNEWTKNEEENKRLALEVVKEVKNHLR
ncbi:HsdM family class I SAM-dependent methyltransferase [Robertmurraya siralis]|uniref:HsdM family class I SAM-dependent methyltransferase n=1 Tax=Robertmurraya siralis TaxID=77777 RepID=UPI000BA7A9AA|nr:N-6 DNA methylase [Robertmurraya siralis]PAE18292.1 hypothetical protein CHH80_22510 [Bacillus sp. 7504-2]